MCGRIVTPDTASIERHWHIGSGNSNPFAARFNAAPQQGEPRNYIPVIRSDQDGRPELVRLQWWLLPYWSKEPRIKYSTFNARVETVRSAPSFRTPLQRRRCLIPVVGWYEWQELKTGKQPWLFRAANDELLHFAGLWDRWKKDDLVIESCTIVVGEPPKAIESIHDRNPFIIPPDRQAAWLDRELTDPDEVMQMLRPLADDALRFHPVSTRVNNARNEGPELLEPITPPAPIGELDIGNDG